MKNHRHTVREWLDRAGQAGFLFFLIKDLAWILAPAAPWLVHGSPPIFENETDATSRER